MPHLAALEQEPQAFGPDTWEIATKAARKLEEEIGQVALGIETPKPLDHVTIALWLLSALTVTNSTTARSLSTIQPETPPLTPNICSMFVPLTVNGKYNRRQIESWPRTRRALLRSRCSGDCRPRRHLFRRDREFRRRCAALPVASLHFNGTRGFG